MDHLTKPKSLIKSWRFGSRKSRPVSSSNSVTTTPSREQDIGQTAPINLAPVVQAQAETPNRNTEHDGQLVLQSSISRPETLEPEDKCKLYSLHDTSTTNILHSVGQFPIDIVALHGLDGGAKKTWTHANGHYWLKDSLPAAFPGARVYSFGYPAQVLFTRGTAGITEFATSLLEEVKAERKTLEQQRRPLIFMCHSMGGIVVKKAFNISVFEERYKPILKEAKAIIFFATPHRGSDYAEFFSKLSGVINFSLAGTSRFSGRTNTELIKSLSTQSRQLSEIAQQFRHRTKDLIIYSLTEDYPTPPLKHKVVEEMSGRLDVDTETAIPMLECDHRTICRFSGPKDPNWKKVYNILEEIATTVTASQ